MTRVTAVILAYGSEPWLERSVLSVLDSTGVDADVVLVDNGCTDGTVERVRSRVGVTVVEPGENLGFAGGNNAGAARATGEFLALVNGDAVVDQKALARLVATAADESVGIATASIRLADAPSRLNSAGNDVHFLGFSWSGRFNEAAEDASDRTDVTGASGAGMAMRRAVWNELGGFDPSYFAYHEDAELSLRCWHRGLRVVYVPDAVVDHRYEFSRNPQKYYLVERNRLAFVLTTFETRTLALIAPALVAFELAMFVYATTQGWAQHKLAGWRWLIANRGWLRTRRHQLQRERRLRDRDLSHLYVSRLDPGNLALPGIAGPVNLVLAAYWAAVRKLL